MNHETVQGSEQAHKTETWRNQRWLAGEAIWSMICSFWPGDGGLSPVGERPKVESYES